MPAFRSEWCARARASSPRSIVPHSFESFHLKKASTQSFSILISVKKNRVFGSFAKASRATLNSQRFHQMQILHGHSARHAAYVRASICVPFRCSCYSKPFVVPLILIWIYWRKKWILHRSQQQQQRTNEKWNICERNVCAYTVSNWSAQLIAWYIFRARASAFSRPFVMTWHQLSTEYVRGARNRFSQQFNANVW